MGNRQAATTILNINCILTLTDCPMWREMMAYWYRRSVHPPNGWFGCLTSSHSCWRRRRASAISASDTNPELIAAFQLIFGSLTVPQVNLASLSIRSWRGEPLWCFCRYNGMLFCFILFWEDELCGMMWMIAETTLVRIDSSKYDMF